MAETPRPTDRRGFLSDGLRITGALALTGAAGFFAGRRGHEGTLVWQLDPDKCVACGHCATYCVLDLSAVKCLNCFDVCGYCDVCTGYFEVNYCALDTGAENQLCPTGAIVRKFVEDKFGQRFYEYTIDRPLCIGCGKCVKGCALMNGSLYLQVEHDRCLNCNECSIASACPTQAFQRVPAEQAEILKRRAVQMLQSRVQKLQQEADEQPERQGEARELAARIERQVRWRAKQDQKPG